MLELIRMMWRIQELELILEEGKIVHFGHSEQQEALKKRIEELIEGLPLPYRGRYRQLRRTGLVVCREKKGVCGNCRMVIAQATLNRMYRGASEWICPNCGRYLLLSDRESMENK